MPEKPYTPNTCCIPNQVIGNGKRILKFRQTWFDRYPWLHYSNAKLGVLCFYCAKTEGMKIFYLAKKRESAFSIDGFRNWKKAVERFDEHEKSQSHLFAVQQLKQIKIAKPVNQQLCNQSALVQQQARNCLMVLMTSVKLLACQGLPLRGHMAIEGMHI